MFSASSLFLLVLSAATPCPERGVLAVCHRAGLWHRSSADAAEHPGHEPVVHNPDCALAQGGQSRLSGPIRLEAALQGPGLWNPSITHPGTTRGTPRTSRS